MVELKSKQLDRTLHALSDRTRRDLLMRLAHGEHSVGELADPYDISLAAVSKHLKVLEKADLIHRRRDGRSFRIRMNGEPLIPVSELIKKYREFWEMRLDELEEFIDKNR